MKKIKYIILLFIGVFLITTGCSSNEDISNDKLTCTRTIANETEELVFTFKDNKVTYISSTTTYVTANKEAAKNQLAYLNSTKIPTYKAYGFTANGKTDGNNVILTKEGDSSLIISKMSDYKNMIGDFSGNYNEVKKSFTEKTYTCK